MGTGQKSQGVYIEIGTMAADPADDTFTRVKGVDTWGEFGPEAPVIDITATDDTSRQKLKGIPDLGDFTFGGNRSYKDAGQAALKAAADDVGDTPYNFKITFDDQPSGGNNPTSISFKAIVTTFRTNAGEVDGEGHVFGDGRDHRQHDRDGGRIMAALDTQIEIAGRQVWIRRSFDLIRRIEERFGALGVLVDKCRALALPMPICAMSSWRSSATRGALTALSGTRSRPGSSTSASSMPRPRPSSSWPACFAGNKRAQEVVDEGR